MLQNTRLGVWRKGNERVTQYIDLDMQEAYVRVSLLALISMRVIGADETPETIHGAHKLTMQQLETFQAAMHAQGWELEEADGSEGPNETMP